MSNNDVFKHIPLFTDVYALILTSNYVSVSLSLTLSRSLVLLRNMKVNFKCKSYRGADTAFTKMPLIR